MIEADSELARLLHEAYVYKLSKHYRTSVIVKAGIDTILQSKSPADALIMIVDALVAHNDRLVADAVRRYRELP